MKDYKLEFTVMIVFTLTSLFSVFQPSLCAQDQTPQKQQQGKRTMEEERLNILKGDIRMEIEEYRKLKKDIDETQHSLDEKNQERMSKVVKMYESMPPEDAARKLEKLDEETAVDILSSLKPKSAGRILAQMENEKAAALSRKIIHKGNPTRE